MEFILTSTTHNERCSNCESELDEHIKKIRASSMRNMVIERDEDGNCHIFMNATSIIKLAIILEMSIIVHPSFKGDPPTLEIYDAYREL